MFVTQREVTESAGRRVSDRRLDYPGVATLSIGVVALLLALDEGIGSRVHEPDDPRACSRRGRDARRVRCGRVPAGGARAGPARRAQEPQVFTAANARVLLMSAIFFSALLYLPAVLDEGARATRHVGVRRGAAADDGRVRGDVVRRRLAVRATRRQADRVRRARRSSASGCCMLSFLDVGLELRVARAGDDRARYRRRALLLVDHDVGGHRARPVTLEPRRRHRLHVPDRRRCGRPRAEHRDRGVGRELEPDLAEGISNAFKVDAALAGGGPRRGAAVRRRHRLAARATATRDAGPPRPRLTKVVPRRARRGTLPS